MYKAGNHTFSVNEDVACYFSEVVTFGEVVAVDEGTVTVSITFNTYPKGEKRGTDTVLKSYVRRDSDGVYSTPDCVSQRVPSNMISPAGEMGTVNQWRYWPSPIERLIRKFKGEKKFYNN